MPGLQHGQLQRLVALLLAAGQIDVERPVEEALVEADAAGLRPAAASVSPPVAVPRAMSASVSMASRRTPGTSMGYCMARYRPATARSYGAMARTSRPSSVTDPPSTS